jgi:uncharacterized RDD family membrane protein YckC
LQFVLGCLIGDTRSRNRLDGLASLLQFSAPSRTPSAAQNGPVIQTCRQCGAVNEEHADTCCFCDASLARNNATSAAVGHPTPAEGNLAVEVDWRREVARRLEVYRARRRRLRPNESQAARPFSPESAESEDNIGAADQERAEERVSYFAPALDLESASSEEDQGSASRAERVEIEVAQPELGLFGAGGHPSVRRPRGSAGTDARFLRVATLGERGHAGLLDAVFLLLAYAGFLVLFRSLGGHFSFSKSDAAVYAATLVLFYAQYFTLFTVFGGSTPGMLLSGLRVTSFDGDLPTPRQLQWRSFGYLISGGTFFLGFLWALWDEDHLTWQDRISQTYLTAAASVDESESVAMPQDTQGFAHK